MNTGYPLGFQAVGDKAFLGTQLNLTGDTLKLQAVGPLYVFNAAHQFYSDLSHLVGAPSPTLTGVTFAGGVLRAAAGLLSAMPNGVQGSAVVLYDVTVMNALIAYLDTGNGLPFIGNGGDISVVWDPLQFGIFQA